MYCKVASGVTSKEHICYAGDIRVAGSIPWLGRSPGGGNGNPVFLPRKSYGERSLGAYSP